MSTIFQKIASRVYWKMYSLCRWVINLAAEFNLPLTKNNWRIAELKNSHAGQRCFIVGNGPSLRPEDLDRLKNEVTFASNKIYKIFDKTTWRPTYYMAVDDVVVKQNFADINVMREPTKFTLNHLKGYLEAEIYFNNNLYNDQKGSFSDNIMESMYSSGSVSFHMLQIAFHMGFSEVYLLGHDHNYKDVISIAKGESEARENRNAKMYFADDYVSGNEKPAETAADEIMQGMEQAKLAYEKAGRKIYNATRISHLDVLERVSFDELTGHRD